MLNGLRRAQRGHIQKSVLVSSLRSISPVLYTHRKTMDDIALHKFSIELPFAITAHFHENRTFPLRKVYDKVEFGYWQKA